MRKLYVILLCSVLSISCTHKSFTPALNSKDTTVKVVTPPIDSSTMYVDTTVCFQRDVLPIFLSSCAKSGCH
ncbi:MAG: hypothetical protein ACTHJ0_04455, partial [Flavipsychrobacter sp.]